MTLFRGSTIGGMKRGVAKAASDWRAETGSRLTMIFTVTHIRLLIGIQ